MSYDAMRGYRECVETEAAAEVDRLDLEVYLHQSLAELLETVSEVKWELIARECERGQLWLA